MADLKAWSTIKSAKNNGTPSEPDMEEKVIQPGETVSQSDLGLDDDQWAQQLESGTVRVMPYPDMPDTYQDSPVNFLKEQATAAAEGVINEAANSEDSIAAIMAANAAGTGTAMLNVEEATGPSEEATPAKAKSGNDK